MPRSRPTVKEDQGAAALVRITGLQEGILSCCERNGIPEEARQRIKSLLDAQESSRAKAELLWLACETVRDQVVQASVHKSELVIDLSQVTPERAKERTAALRESVCRSRDEMQRALTAEQQKAQRNRYALGNYRKDLRELNTSLEHGGYIIDRLATMAGTAFVACLELHSTLRNNEQRQHSLGTTQQRRIASPPR